MGNPIRTVILAVALVLVTAVGASAQEALPPPVAPPPPAPAPQAAPAAQKARTRFVGNLEIDHQFNAIATITYADGSTSSLGDALLGLNLGAAYPLTSDGRFELQALIGVLFARVNASNGDAIFLDFPLEVTAHVNLGPVRIGAGPALQISPMVKGSGFAAGSDVTFDTTIGVIGRVEYELTKSFGLGVHATWMRLSANGQSIDASRIGAVFSLYL